MFPNLQADRHNLGTGSRQYNYPAQRDVCFCEEMPNSDAVNSHSCGSITSGMSRDWVIAALLNRPHTQTKSRSLTMKEVDWAKEFDVTL